MPHILVVEDDPATRLLFAAVLRRHHLDCTTVGDAESALAALHELRFDAVLLDVQLPGISGVDVLREMRRTMPDVVESVVVCTAVPLHLLWQDPALTGISMLLPKPSDIEVLAAAVLHAVENRRDFRAADAGATP